MSDPQYVLRFKGKVSWEGRQNGLPEDISAVYLLENDDPRTINKAVNGVLQDFKTYGGMVVQSDTAPASPIDRILVPLNWIVHISCTLSKLGAELSEPDEDGVERFKDGSVPPKN